MSRNNAVSSLVDKYSTRRILPHWIVFLGDLFLVFFCFFFVEALYNGHSYVLENFLPLVCTLAVVVLVHAIFFKVFHTYRGIIRFSSFLDLQRVGFATFLSAAILIALQYLMRMTGFFLPVLLRVIVVSEIVVTLVIWAFRLTIKVFYDQVRSTDAENALIYGILSGGISLGKSIRSESPVRYSIRGFISHDPSLKIDYVLGEKVYQWDDNLVSVLKSLNIKAMLVPSNRVEEVRSNLDLQNMLIDNGVKILFAQSMVDSTSKKGSKVQLNEIKVEDLLPRDQIQVDMDSIAADLRGKRVLITGSAGSIGSEIVRQVAGFGPAEMILVDQAETPQHDIRLMMAHDFPEIKAHTLMTSIDSYNRMRVIFSNFRPQVVFHAAAYKHVPMMEDNPSSAVHNNIRGTKNIADLSVEFGVEKFVMISTDKAVNPTNVMGCSKRICEIYVQSLNKAELNGEVNGHTQFVTTRFGNVLGSNGSVIPLFRKQISEGGPVTVTHPDIIRYFMLIPEACKLVLEAGTKGKGGEILVFDMGKPVKIADLAKRMIFLSGARNVQIEYTGLREGEKLYEELLSVEENTKPSFHEKIRIANTREYDYSAVCKDIEDLIQVANNYDPMAIVAKMKAIVPEYVSNNSVYSVLDK